MNSFIETLNQYGGRFLDFAWPMLWQSSLLIAFVLALDFLLARKIRASVRYALWLAVLVKLLLPPTLALPTGATWWLFQTKPAPVPVARNFTVTYDTAPQTESVLPAVSIPVLAPKLNYAGEILPGAMAVSVGLLLWLVIRWWQVARTVRRATSAAEFSETVESAQRLAGWRSRVRLKLVEGSMSPAVCGLFRPVVLLPRALAEKLSPAQLNAVLLHEIFHLRRKDVWVNCAQALLQIFYWWHPLLWIANARIRRVREEAVDDAVMLALREEAESYAPTLLEVAKLAFRRPLLSLGLVGIIESRSALRQRIERLVDFRAPRKAGLTFASLCGIFVFSAVALPMGEAPVPLDELSTPAADFSPVHNSAQKTNSESVLIQAQIYRMRQADFEKLISDPAFASTRPDKVKIFQEFSRLLKSSGFQPISRPRILTRNGLPAQFYVGNETNSIEFECRPFVTNGLIDLASRIKMISTTENVTTTNELNNQATLESGGGHVFSIKSPDGLSESNIVVMAIGVQIITNKSQFQQRLQPIIKRADGANAETTAASPQIHIKARFFEVPRGTAAGFGQFLNSTNFASSENFTGILNARNFKAVDNALEPRKGVKILADPEVVTTSGRQTQIRAIEMQTIVTNFVFEEFLTNHDRSFTAKTGPIETGPVFEVMPRVLSDGYTLDLQMTASSMEFYGYADIPTNLPPLTVTTSTGERVVLPRIWPAVLRYQKSAHVNLFDNQTVILSLTNPEQVRFGEPDEKREAVVAKHIRDTAWHNGGRNDILVFVTATIVDAAGNRVHSDDELPFTKDKIPPQPPQVK